MIVFQACKSIIVHYEVFLVDGRVAFELLAIIHNVLSFKFNGCISGISNFSNYLLKIVCLFTLGDSILAIDISSLEENAFALVVAKRTFFLLSLIGSKKGFADVRLMSLGFFRGGMLDVMGMVLLATMFLRR